MKRLIPIVLSSLILLALLGFLRSTRAAGGAESDRASIPVLALAMPLAATSSDAVAVFAGGCFWGIEAVFEHLRGVKSAESGYAGGSSASPTYDEVSSGETGHAEAVRVVYDPSQITYAQLLQVFFSVAHDPTQLNRQGPDVGTQYRSAIFYGDAEQKRAAEAYVAQLTAAKTFPRPIVTQIAPLREFNRAEDYHQDYMAHNPYSPYIIINDAPKVANLRKQFSGMYVERP
jgi:peptide-methionine (S)-S-oxide reductase